MHHENIATLWICGIIHILSLPQKARASYVFFCVLDIECTLCDCLLQYFCICKKNRYENFGYRRCWLYRQ